MSRLIGQDCDISFADMGAQGTTPSGTPVSVKAIARSVKSSETSETKSVRGLGDGSERLRHQYKKETVEIVLLIASTGPVTATVGHYGEAQVYPLAGGTPITKNGLITKNEIDIPDDAQTQLITIECGAD